MYLGAAQVPGHGSHNGLGPACPDNGILHIIVACDSPQGAEHLLHEVLVVIAVSQQGHKDAKASEVYNLLAEFIPNSQAGQGAAEFAQDPWVVRECCAEAGSES